MRGSVSGQVPLVKTPVILTEALNFEEYDATVRSQTDPFPGGAIAQVEGDWICLK